MTQSDEWSRAIILVDMNAFFAAVEQLDNPALRGQPVAITNGAEGSCIITCSYEARAYGIRTGMRLPEAKPRCPHLLVLPSRPKRYTQISRDIMQALTQITPEIEIFSVDEAFLDVTHCQKLFGDPEVIGKRVKQCVFDASGLLCSLGISGDKTTAKFAAKLDKPNGFTVIPPWQAKQRLQYVPVTELCGIGKGIGDFLAGHGVLLCGDMQKLPISVLAKRFGNLGRRMWYMCQGADPDPVHTDINPPKSMGHGKVLPPGTTDTALVHTYLRHMCEKVAARLRRNNMQAQRFFIGVKSYHGWLGEKISLSQACADGHVFYQQGEQILANHWSSTIPLKQIQVTALDPKPNKLQLDLFEETNHHAEKINENRRYN